METGLDNMDTNDSGGVGAKKGFLFQDYVAAYYVTKMLRDKRIKGVCCEVKDDIDIIYEKHVKYIQIKTTDSNSKWGVKELCERTKKKDTNRYNNDSIVHKSIQCDSSKIYEGTFKIITNRDVDSKLTFLKIKNTNRYNKINERDALLKSLARIIKCFKSDNGHDVEYWIDHCSWQVFQDCEHLKLLALANIRGAASDDGFILDPVREEIQILEHILTEVVSLSAVSKKTNISEDKTYFRRDLINWFKSEIEIINQNRPRRVYSRQNKDLPKVLIHLHDYNFSEVTTTLGSGFYQCYDRKSYRFDFISDTLMKWLPEILLRPEELSGIKPTSLLSHVSNIYKSIQDGSIDVSTFMGKTLLHSMLRSHSLSQPIPASLYMERNGDVIEFDNVHIVKNENCPDELWLGLSHMLDGDMRSVISYSFEKIERFIDTNADKHRDIILDIKSDDYLIKHDIDDMLDSTYSINDSLPRIRFVIFIGYKSTVQGLHVINGYEDALKEEVELHFLDFISNLKENYCDLLDLNFIIYLYPVPCIYTLMEKFKGKITRGSDE